ncbi:GvpL/GvpF family gas vesicle protein [Aquabacter spiritensis]|uniref:Gas vesicle protein GvpL/GvpF n=1 Tax=Aquabacter spiritensis TaxID=933073 RepID=A0A4R3LPF3_9HYPH|nr:GvpL/GvpF family gas vesicle protein [Aquabacter spiritensis]TCT02270.1 gas vesicle protein GvpL/GvpF [Aquabacter spiritensis]
MLYVYAITADHPGPHDAGSLPGEGIVPGAPVRLLPFGDLAAAVSPVSAVDFGPEALPARLQDVDWTGQRVLAHQRVVDSLVDVATVLPMKFCTLFSGAAALRAALADNRAALEATVVRLRGAREWGVKLFWEAPPAEPAPVERGPGAGAAFFQRKRDAQRLRAEAEAALAHGVAESHRRLAARARAAVANPVQPAAVHRRRGEMALNGAYLVPRADEAAWRESLAELERTYAGAGIRYELTGPWGPYNFTGGGLAGS